jgi:oligopeptide/dipeptide ABC transporter ATP-binding protein
MEPILVIRELTVCFPKPRSLVEFLAGKPRRVLTAVRNVSLSLNVGQTLGLVGESGCGKSTLGRCIVGLYHPTAGAILYRGTPMAKRGPSGRSVSRRVQMIFQDPYSSLNPRMSVRQTLSEVLAVHRLASGRGEISDRVDELLTLVGLPPRVRDELPKSFSGGQRQRISIARALAAKPEIIIADEPVSALDVSIQAQIINLFIKLQEELGLAYLFIAHDLNVVRHVSHRIAVMYLGQVVESANARELFRHPGHPYTRALLSAIPQPDPGKRTVAASLEGELPDPYLPPAGCSFSSRCPLVVPKCRDMPPELIASLPDHQVRCYRAFEVPTTH